MEVVAPPLIPLLAGAAIGGFVQGLSGFAYGLVALAIWAWVMEPQVAGPMVVFGSLVGQVLALRTIRRGFSPGRTWPFLAGGVLGIPLGAAAAAAHRLGRALGRWRGGLRRRRGRGARRADGAGADPLGHAARLAAG